MAKKIKTKEVHIHSWEVIDEPEPYYHGDNDPPISIYAKCNCGLTLARCEIEDILNKFYK